MCGRYTLYQKADDLAERFKLVTVPRNIPANYNVAPGQVMPVIVAGQEGPQLELMKWGLVPPWAKDSKIGYKLINARDDSIFEKPMWRNVILHKRALIPADGFYEWQRLADPNSHKQPYYIRPKNEALFAFAGVWEIWHDAEGKEWKTYSIITTEPNKEMSSIHNRMPVILHPDDEAAWLQPSLQTRTGIEPFLHPYEDNGLVMHKVSSDVNVVRNNDTRLIYPLNSQ